MLLVAVYMMSKESKCGETIFYYLPGKAFPNFIKYSTIEFFRCDFYKLIELKSPKK